MSERKFVSVASVADLPLGAKKALVVEGWPVLLCHTSEGLFAVSAICSHAYEPLECGRMKAGWIACPVHGARFELATGKALNPPAFQPIATYQTRVSGDTIEIALP